MGAKNSTSREGGDQFSSGRGGPRQGESSTPAATGGNSNNNNRGPRSNTSGAPANQFAQQQRNNNTTTNTTNNNNNTNAGTAPASGATNVPATNRTNLPNKNDKQVQEGQMIKMLATIEASTVSYNPDTHVLRFYITSLCPALTYEIHTGVKESVGKGVVFYMPNKPKIEPTQIPLKNPQENREVTVQLDVSRLEEREKSYDKHYPRQMPCVIVLRYKTTEMKEGSNNSKEEVVVEHAEHTAVDLNPKARRRVISQIVTAGSSSYVVENLFGAEGENGNEVTVGSAVANNGGGEEEDEDILCVICLTNLKDTSVMPCRHMCLCKDCGEQLLKHKPVCPVCRAPISTLLHKPK